MLINPSKRLARFPAPGYALIATLLLLMIMLLSLASAATVWSTTSQREREVELLFVGKQYRLALESYFNSSPPPGALPAKLEDLLEDTRNGVLRRHLRKLYRDPMTQSDDWGLVLIGDRITGVYSKSDKKPFRALGDEVPGMSEAASYQGWKFVVPAAMVSASQPRGGVQLASSSSSEPGQDTAVDSPGATPRSPPEPNPVVKQACEARRQSEVRQCEAVRGYVGIMGADIAACVESAAQRQSACEQALPVLPPLNVPQPRRVE